MASITYSTRHRIGPLSRMRPRSSSQTEFQRDGLYRRFLGDRGRLFVIPVGIDVAASGPSIAKTRPFRIVSIGTILADDEADYQCPKRDGSPARVHG